MLLLHQHDAQGRGSGAHAVRIPLLHIGDVAGKAVADARLRTVTRQLVMTVLTLG